MDFKYDREKSRSNKKKHGIDFNEAQALWLDPYAVVIDAKSDTEFRSALIALSNGLFWTAFFTIRDKKIRLISVRRSRQNEERIYHEC